MHATLFTLTLTALLAGDASKSDTPRKPNPFAPSLPELTEEEEDKLDQIIDRFILFDSGRLPGEDGKRARQEFDKLGPEAIPALIRGLNRAALIDHSCPAVVIASKLSRMLSSTNDTELLEFVRENAGASVTRSRHMSVIKDLRVLCMLRKSEVVRRGATVASAPKVKTPRTMSVGELAEAAGKERGAALKDVLNELGRRRGDEVLAALGSAAALYDDETRNLARDLLTRQVTALSATTLKEKLKDDRAEVRAAAVRVVSNKGLRWGEELIELLSDNSAVVSEAAHQALVRLNRGTDFGPDRDAKEMQRAEAVKKWRAWWAKQDGR